MYNVQLCNVQLRNVHCTMVKGAGAFEAPGQTKEGVLSK